MFLYFQVEHYNKKDYNCKAGFLNVEKSVFYSFFKKLRLVKSIDVYEVDRIIMWKLRRRVIL